MSNYSHAQEEVPPLQKIADLIYAPHSDLPFGKNVRIGLSEMVIYESAIEHGYQAGIRAHQIFLQDHGTTEVIMLDDTQFTMILQELVPEHLSAFEQGLWRSFFIVGWTCVYLGIEANTEDDDDDGLDEGFDQ
ncbi:hypothetical protein [Tengunoibacter tsumagoiensis]|uniref:Uncharacterized protein n=1 Tax=Tengunoibacter tsumagoiensis TaxID=2014871 RepID=A0A402AAI8_9CHLR|nr:hypothetical protein [Tengunoibacter tsumagoiensis]GCE16056.1 hypothetical protein KTT_59150 [Tengunoibacter tsumagoiensis]